MQNGIGSRMYKILKIFNNKYLLLTLLGLFCFFLACSSKTYDFDLYARLIVGEHFWSGLGIAYSDFLSYTPTHYWYDHEWGSGVVFYAFLKLFGPVGLVFIHAITMFFTTFFVIKTHKLQKHAYPVSILYPVIFLLLFFHQNPSTVRCHMFSFMFFAMFIYFLEKTRKYPNSNIMWFIPLITVIWNNLHGGIVSGLGIIGLYILGDFIMRKPVKKYILVLAASIPLLIINPYGIKYVTFLVSANMKSRPHITEWMNLFVERHVRYYMPVFFGVIGGFTAAFINFIQSKNRDITKIIMLVVTLYLSIMHVKLLSLSLIVVFALCGNDIISLFRKKALRILETAAYICVIAAIFYIPVLKPFEARLIDYKLPFYETEFIKMNNLKGNLFTMFGYGSYVSYKLFPDNLIFMDGRYEEVYNDKEFDVLINFERKAGTWDEMFTKYPTEIIMVSASVPAYYFMKNNQAWSEVYKGPLCGVFVKKENKKNVYLYPTRDINYYKNNHFDSDGKFGRKYE